jgi:ABC-type taurine transport system substrate-binding protein
VQLVNLQPPAIIAAWQRGDIDGAYVWAPAVNATQTSRVGDPQLPTCAESVNTLPFFSSSLTAGAQT